MHSRKTVLAALLGLSLFVLGLAVGQGWFTPQPAQAQFGSDFVSIQQLDSGIGFIRFVALTATGDVYGVKTDDQLPSTILRVNYAGSISSAVMPTDQQSAGGLKGSYNK